ncbi:MAG: hypothetical protein ACLFMX_08685 [Halobacteriales archaeon]
MDRDRFVTVALAAIGAVLVGFVLRGLTRVFVDVGVADLVAAPFVLGGFVAIVALAALAGLGAIGVGPLAGRDSH